MKTFKLHAMKIFENEQEELVKHKIQLLDGLIINREDEKNRWVIEAYLESDCKEYFMNLRDNYEEIMVEVIITKESNDPATFITSIIGINDIGDHINVLFMGTIVDQRKNKIEEMLGALINKGYQGEELLDRFKELI
ncbi:YwpF-like protein [Oceanobacillus limi]|uniref:YwpF-like protein n=1 Tax=Oceanobacillus limi TaxID=930131 RepID=A0A1I0D811_9BACI|nr:YwpF family protein [Oceanobacillus limi]SET28378.1 YwpF-like protein [Oceanobacillus limi]